MNFDATSLCTSLKGSEFEQGYKKYHPDLDIFVLL